MLAFSLAFTLAHGQDAVSKTLDYGIRPIVHSDETHGRSIYEPPLNQAELFARYMEEDQDPVPPWSEPTPLPGNRDRDREPTPTPTAAASPTATPTATIKPHTIVIKPTGTVAPSATPRATPRPTRRPWWLRKEKQNDDPLGLNPSPTPDEPSRRNKPLSLKP